MYTRYITSPLASWNRLLFTAAFHIHFVFILINIDWHRSKSITCSRSDATFLFPAAWTQTHRRSQMLTHGAAKKSDSLWSSGWPPVVSMCNPTVWSVRKLSLSVLQKKSVYSYFCLQRLLEMSNTLPFKSAWLALLHFQTSYLHSIFSLI